MADAERLAVDCIMCVVRGSVYTAGALVGLWCVESGEVMLMDGDWLKVMRWAKHGAKT
jgi:hypothetical protein